MPEPATMPNAAAPTVTRTVTPAQPDGSTVVRGAAPAPAPVTAAVPPAAAAAPADGKTPEQRSAEALEANKLKPGTEETKAAQRLALIARREATFVQKQRSWQAEQQRRETALKNQQEQIEALKREVDEFRTAREAAKTDPIAWLKLGGHDYDAATRAALNDGKLPPEEMVLKERERVDAEIAKLREEQQKRDEAEKTAREAAEKSQQEQMQAAQQQAYEEFVTQTVGHVKSVADKYPLITLFGVEAEVAGLIDQHFKRTAQEDVPRAQAEGRRPVGRILSADEAAQLLENYYTEQAEKASATLAARKAAAAAAAAPAAPAPAVNQPITPGQRPTLSNAAAAAPATGQQPIQSADERYKRALALLQAAPLKNAAPTT